MEMISSSSSCKNSGCHLEKSARITLEEYLRAEESTFKQKSRDLAINLGAGNTRYFYGLMKYRHNASYISQITDEEGITYSDSHVIEQVFISHFQKILAPLLDEFHPNLDFVEPFGLLSIEDAYTFFKPVTQEEIEFAVKNANQNKAPGPDGLNAHFYTVCWPIIGADICDATCDLFQSSVMLNQLEATFIVLVPKGDNAFSPKYSPISLSNELYKIITWILVAHLKPLMRKLIGPMQSAFIPGRTNLKQYSSC